MAFVEKLIVSAVIVAVWCGGWLFLTFAADGFGPVPDGGPSLMLIYWPLLLAVSFMIGLYQYVRRNWPDARRPSVKEILLPKFWLCNPVAWAWNLWAFSSIWMNLASKVSALCGAEDASQWLFTHRYDVIPVSLTGMLLVVIACVVFAAVALGVKLAGKSFRNPQCL